MIAQVSNSGPPGTRRVNHKCDLFQSVTRAGRGWGRGWQRRTGYTTHIP